MSSWARRRGCPSALGTADYTPRVPKVARPELNATAASILGFLQLNPMTGFDLMSAIENIIGDFWHVTKSQIYRELKLLAEHDLVETLEAGARDKQPYQITAEGRAAFREWIRQRPTPPIMRMPIVLEVFFGGDVPFEELARAGAAEQPTLHERVDRHDLAATSADRAREHDRRAALVAADLDDQRAVAKLGGGVPQQRGLVLGQPAGDRGGERPRV